MAIPEPEVVIPEVELFSIFWLSVEEEVLLSAPTPGGEVYLKLDQILSKMVKLGQIKSNWVRLGQIGKNVLVKC